MVCICIHEFLSLLFGNKHIVSNADSGSMSNMYLPHDILLVKKRQFCYIEPQILCVVSCTYHIPRRIPIVLNSCISGVEYPRANS